MTRWNDWLKGNTPLTLRVGGILDAKRARNAPTTVSIQPIQATPATKLTFLSDDTPEDQIDLNATDCLLIPALVNAHTHLDLTHIGPQPYIVETGFEGWLSMILKNRATTEADIASATRKGLEYSINGGVVAIADISGTWSTIPTRELANSPLAGTSYIEAFGLGDRQQAAIQSLKELVENAPYRAQKLKALDLGTRVGASPHAPYTAGPDLIAAAATLGSPEPASMVHVAESSAEHQFVSQGTGQKIELLKKLGAVDDTTLKGIAQGKTPVQHVIDALGSNSPSSAFAHVNDASDDDIKALAPSGATVAYCPRASEYFLHQEAFGQHRYQDFLREGIAVALGTDSIVNCPPEHDGRLTPLDDARKLIARDSISPQRALELCTIAGANFLKLPGDWFMFGSADSPGTQQAIAGVSLIHVQDTSRGIIAGAMEEFSSPMLFGKDSLKQLISASECNS